MQTRPPLPPDRPERRASADVLRRQAVLASTLNASGVLDLMPLMAMVLNEDRQIVLTNADMRRRLEQSACGLLGLRLGEALGCEHRHAAETGCGTTPYCCYCGAARAILSALDGRHDVQECRITRDARDTLDAANYQLFSTPLSLAGERFVFASMVDVTSERRVELFQRIFLHDVLDASSGVHGLCQLLAEQATGELRDETEILLSASTRLVDQLLAQRQYAAAENRELAVTPVKLGTRLVLLELVEFFRRQGVAVGKVLSIQPDSEDVFFATDKSLLYRVLSNLTRNALEASAPGEEVRLCCGAAPGGVFYSVRNPAVMDPAVRMQLFTRFFSTKGPGRGLGTYSARLLAEEFLGGRLAAESQPGLGTEFRLTLPAGVAQAPSAWPTGDGRASGPAAATPGR